MALCFRFTSSTFSEMESMKPRISSTCASRLGGQQGDSMGPQGVGYLEMGSVVGMVEGSTTPKTDLVPFNFGLCTLKGLMQSKDGAQSRIPLICQGACVGHCGSHLLEELIHKAVPVHGDSDIVVVIAVLGLHGMRDMCEQVMGGPQTLCPTPIERVSSALRQRGALGSALNF